MDAENLGKYIRSANLRGAALGALSLTLITSAVLGTCAYAQDTVLGTSEANNLLLEKTVDTPTLDYLKDKNILIPQKDANPITSPNSAYTITEGTKDKHTFEYLTVDKDGNIEQKYYNISLLRSENDKKTVKFGKSKNVTWQEVDGPGDNTVQVNLPDKTTKYFQYSVASKDYAKNYQDQANLEYIERETSGSKVYDYYAGGVVKVKDGETETIIDTLFSNNKTELNDTDDVYNVLYGGALYNNGNTTDIAADFTGNSASASYETYGGAIYNSGTIGNIAGDFTDNSISASASGSSAYGGAISNEGTIGNITGDFISNSATSSGDTYGGAISSVAVNLDENNINTTSIGNITGNFIGNSVSASDTKVSTSTYGGAISNFSYGYGDAIIGNITGDFIDNSALADSIRGTETHGGAISNAAYYYGSAAIGDITGDFIDNSVDTYGGAISNYSYGYTKATIGNIIGNFISNKSSYQGGAIHNESYYSNSAIGNITGDFTDNIASFGAAIYNRADGSDSEATIGDITGDFTGNSATLTNQSYGGAIYNEARSSGSKATIGNIFGNFIGNSASRGGVIYNYGYSGVTTIGNIFGNFIGNSASQSGGAIYNVSSKAAIGNIFGDFIRNTASSDGGAINSSGTIGNLTGNFISNSGVSGGAIYKSGGKIGNITGDFTDNSATSSGGAIYNSSGTIGEIIGDFNSNTAAATTVKNVTNANATVTVNPNGGAIYNKGTIGNITGDFNGNTAAAAAVADVTTTYNSAKATAKATANAYGGAIYNTGSIGNITGDFNGNAADADATAKVAATTAANNNKATAVANAYGGVIYNTGSIGEKDANGKIIGGIINSNFYNNYAKSKPEPESESSIAQGGAIWTSKDLNIVADNGSSTFKGNYVQVGEDEEDYQAIWVNSKTANLNLITRNNGTINMHDSINGVTGYKVNIAGDETGTINLYNDIKGGDVNVDTVTVNLIDDTMHNYEFNSLNSNENAKYIIDIDLENKTSDKITVAAKSEGIVLIDYLNIINGADIIPDKDYKIEILYGETEGLQLALSDRARDQLPQDEIYLTSTFEDITDKIKVITRWDDVYNLYSKETEIWGKMGLATTHTTNDSIGITPSSYKKLDPVFKHQLDTLAMWNTLDTDEKKEFNFNSEDDKYLVAGAYPPLEGLGETQGKELSINGLIDENNRSTIDMHSRKGFEIKQAQTFDINNVNITNAEKGALEITNPDAKINLYNTSFFNNTSSTQGAAIYSKADINMTSDGAVTELTGNLVNDKNESVYIADNSKALTINTINDGTFTLNDKINGENGYTVNITGDGTGTFNLFGDIENANVNVDNVTLNFTDGINRDYTFESLNSNANAKYLIGIDLENKTSDSFITLNESTGVITIAGLQIANREFAKFDEEYTIRIINTQTDALQLALSEDLANELNKEEYKIGIAVEEELDEINPITHWKDEYRIYEQEKEIYGKLGLKTSKNGTTNDSIGINMSKKVETGNRVDKGLQGGTLRLWNTLDTNEDKVFNFDSAQNKLLVAKDFPEAQGIEETKGRNITIEGVIDGNNRSTIDLNRLKGFDLKQEAAPKTFTIKNISFENAHDKALEVTDANAKVELYNTSFINNISLEKGGAIYSTADVTMISTGEGVVTELTGNTINARDTDVPVAESVYIADPSKTLTISAESGGTFALNDAINGEEGYKVKIVGDGTGTFNLFGDIKNANVEVGDVTVNLADGVNRKQEFVSLNSSDKAKYIIGIDFNDESCDNFKTVNASSGTVTIAGLQIMGDTTNLDLNDLPTFQILDTQNDNLQLDLTDEIRSSETKIATSYQDVLEDINPTTKWNDVYKAYEEEKEYYGKLNLATTKTKNDSIAMVITDAITKSFVEKGKLDNPLAPWAALETSEVKNFNFDSAGNKITIQQSDLNKVGLGIVKGDELYVNGVIDNNSRSTIDINDLKGFVLNHAAKLNIKNVSLENAYERALEINDSSAEVKLTNINLIGNMSTKQGGAIRAFSDVNIVADGAASEITDNYANGEKEAIYMTNPNKTLTLELVKNGRLILNDTINGEKGYEVNVTGDGTGIINLNNDIKNAKVYLGNATLDMANNTINHYNFDKLTLKNNINFVADVDLGNAKIDRISADEYGTHSGNINVVGLNLLSDSKEGETEILFAPEGLKDSVTNGVKETSGNYRSRAYSPIYKYSVKYDNREDGGYFVFNRNSKAGRISETFNPSVLASPIAAQLGGYLTQLNSYDEAFRNMDTYMLMTKKQRQALKLRNKYASTSGIMTFDPNQNIHDSSTGWLRPYTTFEKVPLKNGPKVSNIAYGTFVGGESELRELGHGWDGIWGAYVGYNGSRQSYDSVGIWQNGGTFGLVGMAYKNNFFGGLTLNAGANAGQASTMYGNEDFTMFMTGVAGKTGYNFEMADGRFIFQPSMLMSYSFVNTFDYTNAAGVKINSDPLNAIQIEPGVKFIFNLRNGWQPYMGVSVVWNAIDKTRFQANDIALPEMSIKPFVKYGVGARKAWGERMTGFFQTYVTGGGRKGVGLQAGFSWALGRKAKAEDKTGE